MRYQLIVLLLFPLVLLAQQPQPPAFYGGSSAKTLNLREGAEGSIALHPSPDFEKFNARYRSSVPQKRKCSTLEIEKDRQAKNNSETLDEFEEWLQQGMQTDRGMRRRSIGESDILTLPVVFHIIYANPTENVSEEQIMSQLRVLNQDYRRRNPDANQTDPKFLKVAADPGIEFCLAKIDPKGNPTSGIERISLGGSPFSDRYINDVIKPSTIWDPTRYMNIWVCNIAGGILGYAQFPSSSGLSGIPTTPGAENTDGVVIHYNAFGTMGTAVAPFNQGRTGTHEIGHWLGLRHVWGDGPCEVDDYCRDTPPTANATYNCPSGVTGCFGAAMFQNFMDYTNDGCMNVFTFDQRERMRNVLQNSPRRKELLDSDVCQVSAEPPVAGFKADIQLGGAPLLVNFTDQSEGDIFSYRWAFEGGEPAASTLKNPQVRFSRPGLHTVSLTVTNTANLTDTRRLESFIWVAEKGATPPFSLNFETANFPPGGTLIYDPYEEGTWKHSARTGGFGSSSGALFFNNFDHKLKGDADWLLTRYLDFSGLSKPVLRFDLAYAKYSGLYSDTLGVFISVGGSEVFEAVYYRGGNELATAEDYLRAFSPFPEEWRTEYIDLSKYAGEKLIQLAFVNLSGYGNNVYVDNIFIGEKPKTAPSPAFSADFTTICTGDAVTFSNQTEGSGNRYRWSFPGGTPATDTSLSPTVQYPKPGLYEVTLTVSNDAGSESKTRQGYIRVNPVPEALTDKEKYRICPGQSATLMASGGDQLSWYNADESEELASGPLLVVNPKQSTAYTLLAVNALGCDATRVVEVIVEAVDNISVEPAEASVCKGQGLVLRARGEATFNWAPGATLSREEGPVVTASPTETTTYVLTGESPGGCKIRREVTIKVIEAPTVYIGAEKQMICQGESVRIRAAGTGPFSWTANGLPTELASDIINVSPSQTTTYEVTAGGIGCQSKASVSIEVREKARMNPERETYVVCPGGQTDLRILGAQKVQWLNAPGLLLDAESMARVGPAQDQEYRAVATDLNGCSDTLSIFTKVAKTDNLTIKNSRPTLCPGMFSELSAEGAVSYQWSPQIGLSNTTGEK
ncbi:MAG: PKD domain-containing protein [Bacteroidia bacterium]